MPIVIPVQPTGRKNWQVRIARDLPKRLKILGAELEKTLEELTEEAIADLLKKYGK